MLCHMFFYTICFNSNYIINFLLLIFHAILNNNKSAYETAKKRAEEAQRQRDEIRETAREINNLKCEMHEIKSLLKQLVEEK